MKVQRQPNRWSCLPTAFAIVLNIPVEKLILLIGHDGSEIVFPELKEPLCRKAFHSQELVDVCFKLGYAAIEISKTVISTTNGTFKYIQTYDIKFDWYVKNNFGVLVGIGCFGQPHAVAWDGDFIYDPNGTIYEYSNFSAELMFVIKPIKGNI